MFCKLKLRKKTVKPWIVERSREIAERDKKLERTSGRGLGERRKGERTGEESLLVYFSSLQSRCDMSTPSRLTRKGLLAVYTQSFLGRR